MMYTSFPEATDGVEDEEYQTHPMPTARNSSDHAMWLYNQLNNDEHNTLRAFSHGSVNPTFTHEASCLDSFTYGGVFTSAPPLRFSHFVQHGFPPPTSANLLPPQERLDVRSFDPFCQTMPPHMMIEPANCHPVSRPFRNGLESEILVSTYPFDFVSPINASPPLSFMSSPEEYCPQPSWTHELSASKENVMNVKNSSAEADARRFDKPYAQLIYDALLRAPGHRMLLRDIYDWFIQNTGKPRESGTNGWQNSIRHNLSMNQAFENDKNDPAATRGARKANSVWVLTEDAIRHGVQSTTRYRKNNSSKKGGGNKAPALQRQRSGARGGRAAKRAARLKRSEDRSCKSPRIQPRLMFSPPPRFNDDFAPATQDECSVYGTFSPTTPEADQFLNCPYGLPEHLQFEGPGGSGVKCDAEPSLDEEDQLRQILSQEEGGDGLEDLARF